MFVVERMDPRAAVVVTDIVVHQLFSIVADLWHIEYDTVAVGQGTAGAPGNVQPVVVTNIIADDASVCGSVGIEIIKIIE